IGLSIVRQLVELHGGSVRATSAGVGKGASFIVALPLFATSLTDSPDDRNHPRVSRTAQRLSEPTIALAGVRVLVIDDEADARALVKQVLEHHGASVTALHSVDDVVALVQQGHVDVLVSDIGMPGEDGYALIKRVRQLGIAQHGNIAAIALTAYARAEDRVRAVAAGFQMHLAKPVEPIELVTMVASAAGRSLNESDHLE
ncbi:MAG: response regulator, partial [Gemmatimonadaceae bacterium]